VATYPPDPLPLRIDEGKGEYNERELRPLSLCTPLFNTRGLKEKEKQKRGAYAPLKLPLLLYLPHLKD
jgi:hypothetical protein